MSYRRGIFTALAAFVICAIPQFSAAQSQQSQTITCASQNNSRQYCRVDTSNGVQLSRQLSDALCTQNSTWGYDANGIWVDQGCRAEFTVNSYNANGSYNSDGSYNNGAYGNNNGMAQAQTVTCSSRSRSATKKYCAADTSGSVTLQRRTSRSSCTKDSSWGYDADGIWVSRGCGGVFAVQPGNNGGADSNGNYGSYGQSGTQAQTIRCESNGDNGRQYCAADTRNGVRLSRQISSARCDQNATWGYDNNGVWVSNGCSADFDLNANNYSGPRASRGGSNQGYTNTRTIRCESTDYSNNSGRQYCQADARGGVHMLRELSSNQCRQGSSWGYDNNGVWVSNGCRADFEVDGTRRNATGATTTLPSGTQLSIRADEAIDSKTASVGQRYAADVATDVSDSSGNIIIPHGSPAELIIHHANDNSNTNSNNNDNTSNKNLVLDLDSLTVNGTRYIVSTQDLTSTGGTGIGANKKTGEYVGAGAVLGALIGAIAGGGKGAAIGAGVGAAAGAGGVILTKGKQVNVPVETVLNFKLDQDLRLQAVR